MTDVSSIDFNIDFINCYYDSLNGSPDFNWEVCQPRDVAKAIESHRFGIQGGYYIGCICGASVKCVGTIDTDRLRYEFLNPTKDMMCKYSEEEHTCSDIIL
jgi:hypothetical protein